MRLNESIRAEKTLRARTEKHCSREKAQFGLLMMLFGPGDFSHLSVPEKQIINKVEINENGRTNVPERK